MGYIIFTRWLVVNSADKYGIISVLDSNNDYKLVREFKKMIAGTKSKFLDNDTIVSVGGAHNEIYVWNFKTGKIISKISGVGKGILKVNWNNDNIVFQKTYDKL